MILYPSNTYIKQEMSYDDIAWHNQDFTEKEHKVTNSVDSYHPEYVIEQNVESLHSSLTEIRWADR